MARENVEWPRRLREMASAAGYAVYKAVISPLLHAVSPSRCIFLPTCSEYAYTAVSRFGWLRGSWMAARRVARCHPFARGGFDPVPGQDTRPASAGSDRLP